MWHALYKRTTGQYLNILHKYVLCYVTICLYIYKYRKGEKSSVWLTRGGVVVSQHVTQFIYMYLCTSTQARAKKSSVWVTRGWYLNMRGQHQIYGVLWSEGRTGWTENDIHWSFWEFLHLCSIRFNKVTSNTSCIICTMSYNLVKTSCGAFFIFV